jgi:hypothetical protein
MRAIITRSRRESRYHGGQWVYTATLEGEIVGAPFGAFHDGRPVLTRDDTSIVETRSYLKRKGITFREVWKK